MTRAVALKNDQTIEKKISFTHLSLKALAGPTYMIIYLLLFNSLFAECETET